MTDLSPAQKALAAFNERDELCGPFDVDWVEQCLAAALEAVAGQGECVEIVTAPGFCEIDAVLRVSDILAIAAELRTKPIAMTDLDS